MVIPRQINIYRSENSSYTQRRVSRVRHYNEAMLKVFPYYVVVEASVAKVLTDRLGAGFSEGDYGPFWPSFASMNSGEGDNKVVWFSQAGLECLQKTGNGGYLFLLEERDPALVRQDLNNPT